MNMDVRVNIARLLGEHDCVIIPGFGGFIGNYAPARIDPVSHSFLPPSKKILFNINLKQNDGLLCNSLMNEEGVSYADALALVNDMVATARHDLKNGKPFIIQGVGRLFSGREGNLQFEQQKDCNLLPDAFGLQTFIAPPIERNSYANRFEKALVPDQKGSPAHKRSIPRSLKWAAMLAIPIGAAAIIGITQYDKIKNPSVNNAGILTSVFSRFSASSLVEKKEAPSRQPEVNYDFGAMPPGISDPPPAPVNTGNDPDLDQLVNSAGNSADQISERNTISGTPSGSKPQVLAGQDDPALSDQPEINVKETASGINPSDRYAIIIGAFRVKENALKCVKEANSAGLNAGIFDRSRTGLYRVACSTSNNRDQAETMLSDATSKGYSGAWLLSK